MAFVEVEQKSRVWNAEQKAAFMHVSDQMGLKKNLTINVGAGGGNAVLREDVVLDDTTVVRGGACTSNVWAVGLALGTFVVGGGCATAEIGDVVSRGGAAAKIGAVVSGGVATSKLGAVVSGGVATSTITAVVSGGGATSKLGAVVNGGCVTVEIGAVVSRREALSKCWAVVLSGVGATSKLRVVVNGGAATVEIVEVMSVGELFDELSGGCAFCRIR